MVEWLDGWGNMLQGSSALPIHIPAVPIQAIVSHPGRSLLCLQSWHCDSQVRLVVLTWLESVMRSDSHMQARAQRDWGEGYCWSITRAWGSPQGGREARTSQGRGPEATGFTGGLRNPVCGAGHVHLWGRAFDWSRPVSACWEQECT